MGLEPTDSSTPRITSHAPLRRSLSATTGTPRLARQRTPGGSLGNGRSERQPEHQGSGNSGGHQMSTRRAPDGQFVFTEQRSRPWGYYWHAAPSLGLAATRRARVHVHITRAGSSRVLENPARSRAGNMHTCPATRGGNLRPAHRSRQHAKANNRAAPGEWGVFQLLSNPLRGFWYPRVLKIMLVNKKRPT